jgi:hypothetical protein
MPDQLFTAYMENQLVMISIDSGDLGANGCFARHRKLGNWQWWLKGGPKKGMG